jgi:hypothetical protein
MNSGSRGRRPWWVWAKPKVLFLLIIQKIEGGWRMASPPKVLPLTFVQALIKKRVNRPHPQLPFLSFPINGKPEKSPQPQGHCGKGETTLTLSNLE